jgi:TfoX/Sxy family transcriptional regulator of competence genes
MAAEYLERLRALIDWAQPLVDRPLVDKEITLEFKHFFSGAALYADGNICISLTPAGLALKLPEEDRKKLKKEGARALRYFAKGPIKKEYVVVPGKIREDKRKLKRWTARAINYALPSTAGGGKTQ